LYAFTRPELQPDLWSSVNHHLCVTDIQHNTTDCQTLTLKKTNTHLQHPPSAIPGPVELFHPIPQYRPSSTTQAMYIWHNILACSHKHWWHGNATVGSLSYWATIFILLRATKYLTQQYKTMLCCFWCWYL